MIAQYVMASYMPNRRQPRPWPLHIREAKKALFSSHGSPPGGAPPAVAQAASMREQQVLGMMDNRTGQLDVLDQHDDLIARSRPLGESGHPQA